MNFLFSQAVSTVDASEVGEWKFYVFVGVCLLIILGTVIPCFIKVMRLMLEKQADAHSAQMEAQAAAHKAQVDGLMEHQKDQIVRICDSNVRSFERTTETFEKSMEKRDHDHAAIMAELRIINDKVDDVKNSLDRHIRAEAKQHFTA